MRQTLNDSFSPFLVLISQKYFPFRRTILYNIYPTQEKLAVALPTFSTFVAERHLTLADADNATKNVANMLSVYAMTVWRWEKTPSFHKSHPSIDYNRESQLLLAFRLDSRELLALISQHDTQAFLYNLQRLFWKHSSVPTGGSDVREAQRCATKKGQR